MHSTDNAIFIKPNTQLRFAPVKSVTFVKSLLMNTVYHLNSAQEVTPALLDSIKAAFQSRPITITVEDDSDSPELTAEQREILDTRLGEPDTHYISSEKSIAYLKEKYGL